ncbi:hypothetical protein MMC25_004727 [Agyrium rufum]|nr:hypothetical protein [Agyrium rufum]
MSEISGPNGYALPSNPIPIVLARDEEIGISGTDRRGMSNATKPQLPPPVYGLWRGSVRADPKLIHWQRVAGPSTPDLESAYGGSNAAQRPPSYVSENPIGGT